MNEVVRFSEGHIAKMRRVAAPYRTFRRWTLKNVPTDDSLLVSVNGLSENDMNIGFLYGRRTCPPGVRGILIPTRDSKAIVEAIRWLVEHPEEAWRMARRVETVRPT